MLNFIAAELNWLTVISWTYDVFITFGKYCYTSSQLANSIRYHFQIVFTSGELGNFNASPFVPLGVLDLVGSLFGPKYAENCNKLLIRSLDT